MKYNIIIPGKGHYFLSMRPQSSDAASFTVTLTRVNELSVPGSRKKLKYECSDYQQAIETFNTIKETLEL